MRLPQPIPRPLPRGWVPRTKPMGVQGGPVKSSRAVFVAGIVFFLCLCTLLLINSVYAIIAFCDSPLRHELPLKLRPVVDDDTVIILDGREVEFAEFDAEPREITEVYLEHGGRHVRKIIAETIPKDGSK